MITFGKRGVCRILLFSDPHYSKDSLLEEEKWFPPVCAFLKKIQLVFLVKKFLRFWDRMTQEAFVKMLLEVKKKSPFDFAIGLGDYTPGANESGMLTKKTFKQYRDFKNIFDKYVKCDKALVWGDHDAGYRFSAGKVLGTERGGLSVKSVKSATELIGLPFGSVEVGPVKFIYISTNLVRNVDENSHPILRDLKVEQESFLAKELNWSGRSPVFIFAHDPTALGKETAMRKIIDSHRKKVTAIVHGHLHAEFSRRLAMLSSVYGGLCQEYETILVPASWGMMGIGRGFKILNIHKNGSYSVESHKV